VFAVATRCFIENAEPRADRRTLLLFVSHNSCPSNADKQLMSARSVVKPVVPLLAAEILMKRPIDDFTACQACWAVRGMVL